MDKTVKNALDDPAVVHKLCFATRTLPVGLPNYWDIAANFSISGKVDYTLTGQDARVFIDNVRYLNPSVFDSDYKLTKELVKMPKSSSGDEKIGIPLISPNDKCLFCRSKLYIRADRCVQAILYDSLYGSLPAIHYTRYCRKKNCSFNQHYGYYTRSDCSEATYNNDAQQLPYFMCSRETAFSTEILRKFDIECLIGQISYKQAAEIFNCYHGYECDDEENKCTSGLLDRIKMDRRRLEHAHMRYAMLNVAKWHEGSFDAKNITFSSDQSQTTLLEFTPLYLKAFYELYSGHRCSKAGCGQVLVIDGNLKNHRAVCAATDAGYIEYCGLPGSIKSGCTNTPLQKSRFCEIHKPRTLVTPGESLNSVIEMILEKKTLRSHNLYKVLWLGREECDISWVKEDEIPKSVLKEFEENALVEIEQLSVDKIGQTSYTLSVQAKKNEVPPVHKKKKQDRFVVDGNNGAFALSTDIDNLECNTRKEKKERLHERSAGLLAGIWPCGVITMIDELFTSESLSQVYACLHGFIHANFSRTQTIDILCYDDGCHLRRYARNCSRSQVTQAATKLASLNIVIDKLHFKGHTDPWCHSNCNPYNVKELEEVDTEICEQTFSWLSRYGRITRYMNKEHFLFFILYISELHNRRLMKMIKK